MTPNGGSATISAIAVFENARVPDETKSLSLAFDAHLFFGPQSQGLAALRYFNGEGRSFNQDEVEPFFIVANVARIPEKAEGIASPGLTNESYTLFGDIVSIIPAGTDVDVRHRPFITISGIVDRVDDSTRSFDITSEQYVGPFKNTKKDLDTGTLSDMTKTLNNSKRSKVVKPPKPTFPARVVIPDIPRWNGDKKPNIKPGGYVSVGGFLTGVARSPNSTTIERFIIEIEKVTFLGRAPSLLVAAEDGHLQTPVKGKGSLKFDYNSPSPLPAKRRRLETETSFSSTTSQ